MKKEFHPADKYMEADKERNPIVLAEKNIALPVKLTTKSNIVGIDGKGFDKDEMVFKAILVGENTRLEDNLNVVTDSIFIASKATAFIHKKNTTAVVHDKDVNIDGAYIIDAYDVLAIVDYEKI